MTTAALGQADTLVFLQDHRIALAQLGHTANSPRCSDLRGRVVLDCKNPEVVDEEEVAVQAPVEGGCVSQTS